MVIILVRFVTACGCVQYREVPLEGPTPPRTLDLVALRRLRTTRDGGVDVEFPHYVRRRFVRDPSAATTVFDADCLVQPFHTYREDLE